MRFSTSVIISALAASAAAQQFPTADTSKPPSGNAINLPKQDENLPKNSKYTVSWTPTSTGSNVALVLLRGCPKNCLPVLTIAQSIPNSGAFDWTVQDSIEPDTTYGIELIVESDKSYQYSNHFVISGASGTTGGQANNAPGSANNNTSTATVIYATGSSGFATAPSATGTGNVSIPVLTPTNPMTVPGTLQSTATQTETAGGSSATGTGSSASSLPTGAANAVAASRNVGALALAGLAVAALAL